MTPMYDGEWSWVNHSEVMRGSVSADPVEELLKGVRDRFGESKVAERCRARYDVGHLCKDRMEDERRSEPVDLDAPEGVVRGANRTARTRTDGEPSYKNC
jgi:hypothetical protein